MPKAINRKWGACIALSLSITLGACGSSTSNQTLNSVHQPVIERSNYTLDLQSGMGGLAVSEQKRLADWFESMGLRYGDRVSIDDPSMNASTRNSVGQMAARHGILVSDGAPVTTGYITPGHTRVVITRSIAHTPNCPNWSSNSDTNLSNSTSSNYGCSVNGNMAAMIANPEDLITGQRGSGTTIVTTSNKAINSHREKAPSGQDGLADNSTGAGG